jgi:hypothetical protein
MEMRQINKKTVVDVVLRAIGFDPSRSVILSIEAISNMIRRVAAFACPCSEQNLVKVTLLGLEGLSYDPALIRDLVESSLEAIISCGDLIILKEVDQEEPGDIREVLYVCPPSFVNRASGSVILMGVGQDNAPILPPELNERLVHRNHMRVLFAEDSEDLPGRLGELGLIELSMNAWLKLPNKEQAETFIDRINLALEYQKPSGEILDLTILDTRLPVNFYRGRWVEPRDRTGRFIGRRKRAYGNDIWCYVNMQNGKPTALIDLPLPSSATRGCDEAWRIQAALDHLSGHPQVFRKEKSGEENYVVKLFSPLPVWARRRLESLGEPANIQGALLGYIVPEREIAEEIQFLIDYLWMISLD